LAQTSILGDTNVRSAGMFTINNAIEKRTLNTTTVNGYYAHTMRSPTAPCSWEGCDLGNGLTYFYGPCIKSVITDASDPINNFTVYDTFNDTTKCKTAEVKVYEKVNGVQIFP
jgi:hypothetical protein